MSKSKTPQELRQLRKSKGIKLRWVADKIGISDAMMCYLEQGKRSWTPALEEKFLKAIGEL